MQNKTGPELTGAGLSEKENLFNQQLPLFGACEW